MLFMYSSNPLLSTDYISNEIQVNYLWYFAYGTVHLHTYNLIARERIQTVESKYDVIKLLRSLATSIDWRSVSNFARANCTIGILVEMFEEHVTSHGRSPIGGVGVRIYTEHRNMRYLLHRCRCKFAASLNSKAIHW